VNVIFRVKSIERQAEALRADRLPGSHRHLREVLAAFALDDVQR